MDARTLLAGATGRKMLLSAGLIGAAASIAGLASYATFTDSESVSGQTIASGTVDISIGANGTANNRLTVGASDIAAGDTMQRAVTVSNGAGLDWASLELTTTASSSSVLDTDTTDGLQMTIDKCSVAWTESGPPYTYTCGGTSTNLVASRPVIGSNIDLGAVDSTTASGTDYLRVTLELPTSAGNGFQGKSSTIDYTFTAVQRTGTAQ